MFQRECVQATPIFKRERVRDRETLRISVRKSMAHSKGERERIDERQSELWSRGRSDASSPYFSIANENSLMPALELKCFKVMLTETW